LSKIEKNIHLESLEGILKEPIIAPDHVRGSKGEKIGKEYSCEYRTLKDLLFTGLNYADINYCSENAFHRLKRTKLEVNDILFAGSGVGAIGRLSIIEKVSGKSCVGDLFILRSPKINPYYLYTFLLTEYGQSQIKKIFHGIQSAKISTKEIGQIRVAILDTLIQNKIESEYKKMSKYHEKAMSAKKYKDEKEYTKNIETADQMLKDLIAKVEAIIRGEREDVI
jgi:restriction endonuclease S subunit